MLNSPLASVVKSPWFVAPVGLTSSPWKGVVAGKPLRLGRTPFGTVQLLLQVQSGFRAGAGHRQDEHEPRPAAQSG